MNETEWAAVTRAYGIVREIGYQNVMRGADVGLLLHELRGKIPWRQFEQEMAQALGLQGADAFHVGHRLMTLGRHRELLVLGRPTDQFAAQKLINETRRAQQGVRGGATE